VCAIRYKHKAEGHPSPVDRSVTDLLSGLARQLKERPRGRRALTPSQLQRVSARLAKDGSPIAARDRALLVLGFALGWRGSELARLQVADVSLDRKGLRIFQGWSKTDQEGKGREVGIPHGRNACTCPVVALDAWLKIRGRQDGPLFCAIRKSGRVVVSAAITGEVVNQVLKARMRDAGMEPGDYGSHSLRAGCVTAAAESGATELAIMQRTGHRSIEMVLKYTRPARAFACDPLAGVL
jgi:integrase